MTEENAMIEEGNERSQDDHEDLSPTTPTSTAFNSGGDFHFGNNSSSTNQTVPEHNQSNLDENNARFQF